MSPWLACLMGLTFLPSTVTSRASERTVRVEVVNSSNHRSIREARVFVLSLEGQELASATTDEHGLAALPRLEESGIRST